MRVRTLDDVMLMWTMDKFLSPRHTAQVYTYFCRVGVPAISGPLSHLVFFAAWLICRVGSTMRYVTGSGIVVPVVTTDQRGRPIWAQACPC